MRAGRPRTQGRAGLRVCGRDARAPRDAQDCAYAGETPAHPGTRRIARMRARRPRTQGRAGLRVCGRDARAPGTLRIARMRAGTPAHPARSGLRVCGRGRPRTQGRSGLRVCGRERPRSWHAPGSRTCGRDARAPGTRRGRAHAGGTPALPGTLSAIAPQGLPGAQRGLQPAVSACGRDARAPRDALRRSPAGASRCSARASARSLRMRAGRPAHPGCTWFSVPGSWFSVRDACAPRGHVVLGSWFLVLGSGRPRTRHVVLGSWFLVLGSGRPRSQGRAGLRVCGRDARAPGTRRIARMRAGRPRTQGARGSPLLQGWYGIGARRVPGCPIAVRPVHATFRDGKQKPRTRSPQLPGAVWRARPAQ